MTVQKYREHIPFFSDLPTKAVVAAAALWDAARGASYNGALAYNEFVQDLSFQEIAAPPRAVVKRWVAGVQAGLVARPIHPGVPEAFPQGTAKIDCDLDDVAALAEELEPFSPTDQSSEPDNDALQVWSELAAPEPSMSPHMRRAKLVADARGRDLADPDFHLIVPADFAQKPADGAAFLSPADVLRELTERMVHEEVTELQKQVRDQARRNVATRLRSMLDDMEKADV